MTSEQTQQINQLLGSSKNILILTHHNPDGDAIGSSLALYNYLLIKGYNSQIIVPNDFPAFLSWMPGQEKILVYTHHKEKADEFIDKADIIFCLDFNAIVRLEKLGEQVSKNKAVRIMIDHHPQPACDFDFAFSDINASSTSELIYDFIEGLGGGEIINKAIAECIYVGMMTDTGSFSYSCNSEHTYLIVAKLFKLGIDGQNIHRLVYDTYSEYRLRLLGYSLSEKFIVKAEYHTAYIYLTRAELLRFNYKIGDTEGLVNYALSIRGINLAVLFVEKEGAIRLSIRSKGDFSVNDFARKHFNGGGHRNAAGGDSYLSMDETIQFFESLLPEYKNALSLSSTE